MVYYSRHVTPVYHDDDKFEIKNISHCKA